MVLATTRPCTPILEQLAPQPFQEIVSRSASVRKAAKEQRKLGRHPVDASLEAAAARLRALSANEHLASWTAEISWFDDPLEVPGRPLSNEVCSTIRVEVAPAELV
jgi:hypothetical protein